MTCLWKEHMMPVSLFPSGSPCRLVPVAVAVAVVVVVVVAVGLL